MASMVDRSVRCTLINRSHHNLWLIEATLAAGSHGAGAGVPARVPLATDDRSWECVADDPFGDGISGSATFGVGDTGKKLTLAWSSSNFGANRFTQAHDVPDHDAHDP